MDSPTSPTPTKGLEIPITTQILTNPWIWQIRPTNNPAVIRVDEIEFSPPNRFEMTDNCADDPEQNLEER